MEEGVAMTPKEKLIQSIARMISGFDEELLRAVYHFVLHLRK